MTDKTTPSETMAGKLLKDLAAIVGAGPEDAYLPIAYPQFFAKHADTIKALAASEPVEQTCSRCGAPTDPDCGHVGQCASEPVEAPRTVQCGCCGVQTVAIQADGRCPSCTGVDPSKQVSPFHPAPEQPGKGDPNGQHCPNCRFTMSGLGYCVNCKWSAPQPSDPAEGDACALDEALRRLQPPSDVVGGAEEYGFSRARDMAAHLVRATLSTPPTAAVRVDDEEFRKFDNAVRTWLARRYIQTWDKIRAALDPQVKR